MEWIEAIVCRSLDYKDSSKILYLYTDHGTMSIIARGVKKLSSINRFLSQNGNLIKFSKTKGDFPYLKEGELINDYENIKLDLETYTFMNHILELVNNVIDDHNDHVKMYDFIKRLLDLFNQELDPELLTFIFELKLLHFLGYGLHFKSCSICDNPENLVYSISDGGLVCRHHLPNGRQFFDEYTYSKIKELYYMDINKYNKVELSKSERIMMRHIIDVTYEEFICYKTKSRGILKQIKKY